MTPTVFEMPKPRIVEMDGDVFDGPSSYVPVVLADVRAGDVPPPTVLVGVDGAALFYRMRTNMLMAESEAGKTWLALFAARQVLADGGRVLVIDYEDEAANFKSRMLALGIAEAVIDDPGRVTYVRPEEPLRGRDGTHTRGGIDFDALTDEQFDLAVIDGVTDAMVLEGSTRTATPRCPNGTGSSRK